MKCSDCGLECYDEDGLYPQAVFWNKEICICEECSIDYEEIDGKIQMREEVLKWITSD